MSVKYKLNKDQQDNLDSLEKEMRAIKRKIKNLSKKERQLDKDWWDLKIKSNIIKLDNRT